MTGGGAFTFLIHAEKDKPRLVPIVRHLIGRGVTLWIDKPYEPLLGLAPAEIAQLAGWCEHGREWSVDRDTALNEAGAFLLALTPNSIAPEREQVRYEAFGANLRSRGSGIPVFPVGLGEGDLERGSGLSGNRQGFKTFVEPGSDGFVLTAQGRAELDLLADKLLEVQAAPRAVPRPAAELPASPFFADRQAQSQELTYELRGRRKDPRARLPLPVLIGNHPDRPDTYVNEYLVKKLLPAVTDVKVWGATRIAWPYQLRERPERACDVLLEDIIGGEQGLLPGSIIHCQPPAEELARPGGMMACLDMWCRVWSRIATLADTSRVVPLIDVRSDYYPVAVRAALFGRTPSVLSWSVRRAASQLERRYDSVSLLPLAPLGKVRPSCVESWVDSDLRPMLAGLVHEELRAELLRGYQPSGLAMEAWAARARTAYRAVSQGGGRP